MSNPALKKVVEGSSQNNPAAYQTWNTPGQQGFGQPSSAQPGYGFPGGPQPGYPQQTGFPQQGYPQQAGARTFLAMDDVVIKTVISIATVIVSAVATWVIFAPEAGSGDYSRVMGVAIGGLIVGFILGMVNAFKRNPSAPLVLLYCVAQGALLGGISGIFETMYPGIVIQAMIGTFGVFVGMLVVYRTGAIRVTPKFQRWLAAAVIGALILMVFNLVFYFVTGSASFLRDGGPMAIGFSLLMIGIAAFTLLADFDLAEQAIRQGAPKNFAWGIAFGLVASLVWLYIEILRLISYFRE